MESGASTSTNGTIPEKGLNNAENVNPLDVKSDAKINESDLITSIVSSETSTGEDRILEDAPEIDVSLLQDIEPPKSILLIVLKAVFGLFVGLSLASLLFFSSQLTSIFDLVGSKLGMPNISKELASSNSEITTLQTDLNLYRYLQIKANLDEFSYYGDSYLQSYETANSLTAESDEKKTAVEEMSVLKEYLRSSFIDTKGKLALNFISPLVSDVPTTDDELKALFSEQLTAQLNKKLSELSENPDPQAKREYRNYTHTINLVGNLPLNSLIVQTDFDALSDKELYGFIKNVKKVIVNDLSIIQEIKEKRIKWSDVMHEIELRTIAVDSYYSKNFYDELGGIRYTSYDFDTENSQISIVGETKRFDTTNFTMISNLIDELNRSEFFKDVGMKSFSKTGSLDSGYVASIKLTLGLESTDFSDKTSQIPVTELPEFLNGTNN